MANLKTSSADRSIAHRGIMARLAKDTSGNTIAIVAAALFPLAAMIGGGVDMSRAYMAQTRLQQACDAAALAGRRAMTGSTFTTANQAEARKFFDFNFPQGAFGTHTFTPTIGSATGDSKTVRISATTTIPTAVMKIFQYDEMTLSVSCDSTMNVPNTDVMFVLDITGSMADTISDGAGGSVQKIAALKSAVKDFYDALGPGSNSTGRVRYGFVPYSSTVNVGYLLPRNHLIGNNDDETWQYQSREAIYEDRYIPETYSSESAASSGTTTYTRVPSSYSNMSSDLTVGGVTYKKQYSSSTTPAVSNSAQCAAVTVPFSNLTLTGSPTTTLISQTTPTPANPVIVKTYEIKQNYSGGTMYRYNWSSSKCNLQSGTITQSGRRTITYTTTTTVTSWTSVNQFSKWLYKERDIDVSTYITGVAVPNPAYDAASPNDSYGNAAPATATWEGCIEERDTDNSITAASSLTIPNAAFDMNIDRIPDSAATRWRPMWPEVTYWRYTDGTTTKDTNSTDTGESQFANRANGWAACPTKARKLFSYTARTATPTGDTTGLTSFDTYVNSLSPVGGTYHDIGMIWGARLISAEGLFASENNTAPNGFTINRHIVFMTDGQMSTVNYNHDAWGMNFWDGRITATSADNTTLTAIHNRRLEMICNAVKGKGITVWVVAFGTALNSQLSGCASGTEYATTSTSSSALRTQFQAIANNIGGLRLSL